MTLYSIKCQIALCRYIIILVISFSNLVKAIIDLTQFTTSGKKRRGFRATLNKFDDLNIQFEILEPPFSKDLIFQLKQVSNQWLDGRNEMHFSVGQFTEEYLQQAPIGIMKNER